MAMADVGDMVQFKYNVEGRGYVIAKKYRNSRYICSVSYVIANEARDCEVWHPSARYISKYGCAVVIVDESYLL